MSTAVAVLTLPGGVFPVSVPDTSDYGSLRRKVQKICGSKSFRMKYRDDEGDLVTIGSDSELEYAFSVSEGALEIIVEKHGEELSPLAGSGRSNVFRDELKSVVLVPVPNINISEPTEVSVKSVESVTPNFVEVKATAVASTADSSEDLVGKSVVVVEEKDQQVVELSCGEQTPVAQEVKKSSEEASNAQQQLVCKFDTAFGLKTKEKESPKKDTKQEEGKAEKNSVPAGIDVTQLKKHAHAFMCHPEVARFLGEHMGVILPCLAASKSKLCFTHLRDEALKIPTIASHPFFKAILPNFDILVDYLDSQLQSTSSTFAVLASTLSSTQISKNCEHKASAKETPKPKVARVVSAELGAQKPKVAPVAVAKAPKPKPKLFVEKVEEAKKKAAYEVKEDTPPSTPKKASSRPKDYNREARKAGLVVSVGMGNYIKWKFEENTIPTIKFFKNGWRQPQNSTKLAVGDRLVRINDLALEGFNKDEVQELWLKENGGGENTRLYFLKKDKIHPFEKYAEQLDMVGSMGFPDVKRNRKLLEYHGGNAERVINVLLAGATKRL